MKAREIRELETPALQEQLESKRQELFNLRIKWSTGSLDDPTQLKKVRKDIARMLTILRERELAAELVERES